MQRSGQITLTSTEQFPDISCLVVLIKAHPDNTDTIWIGNDGADSVASTTGFPLNPGESMTLVIEGNMNSLFAVADVSTEKLCWIILE